MIDPSTTPADAAPANPGASRAGSSPRSAWLWPSIVVMVLTLVGLGSAWLRFGSTPLAIRYARGERLIVASPRLHLAGLTVADRASASTEIHNYTRSPVRLLGSAANCTCVTVQDLPPSIPAGGEVRLSLLVHAQPNRPTVDQTIILFTDYPGLSQLGVRVTGTARDVSPPHQH